MKRVGVFGWGIVAPKSPDVDAFARNLESPRSWLEPFDGFGPNNFLVGVPEFDFGAYEEWVNTRFSPRRFGQLEEKMGFISKYAIGAFIQALGQNPGLEEELAALGGAAHVYLGTGLGAFPTLYDASVDLWKSQRRWNRFWARPERNSALRKWIDAAPAMAGSNGVPPAPESVDPEERPDAEEVWDRYWMERSPELAQYLAAHRAIEQRKIEGDVEKGKLWVIKTKRRQHLKLLQEWGAPPPPWTTVSANVIWNIPNTPASQVSILGRITGPAFAPVGACSTFGLCLKLAMDAIESGRAKAVVIGATDPPPHPLAVGAFYQCRVIQGDGDVSKPLTALKGTHVAGGSVVWIVGDWEYFTSKGYRPLGMEPVGVGVTSDADHLITPTKEGSTEAIRLALEHAGYTPADVDTWDLHATATPGDFLEVETLRDTLPESVLVTARKGTFGHGMSAGGGWELTAQYLGAERGRIYPTPLSREELNPEIAGVHDLFVYDRECDAPPGGAGKLSMGVGGINACVVSRPIPGSSSGT